MKYIYFVEPHAIPGAVCYVQLTEDQAIEWQRSYAVNHKGFVYQSDQEALDDFMVVNWASHTPPTFPPAQP